MFLSLCLNVLPVNRYSCMVHCFLFFMQKIQLWKWIIRNYKMLIHNWTKMTTQVAGWVTKHDIYLFNQIFVSISKIRKNRRKKNTNYNLRSCQRAHTFIESVQVIKLVKYLIMENIQHFLTCICIHICIKNKQCYW